MPLAFAATEMFAELGIVHGYFPFASAAFWSAMRLAISFWIFGSFDRSDTFGCMAGAAAFGFVAGGFARLGMAALILSSRALKNDTARSLVNPGAGSAMDGRSPGNSTRLRLAKFR